MTFSLTGFTGVRREGVILTAEFTASINAELTVGTVEETITVSGESPVVDVHSPIVQNVMSRDLLDAIPSGRSYQAIAQTTPGIVVSRPDMAGTENFFSTNLRVHGSITADQAIHLDGMDTTSGESDGRFQGFYRDDGDNEEVVYTTSAIPAEVSKGGVRINMIGREGGNTFRGSYFLAETPGSLQSNNLTDDLKARGLPSASEIRRIFDHNLTFGGPFSEIGCGFFRRGGGGRTTRTPQASCSGTGRAPGRRRAHHRIRPRDFPGVGPEQADDLLRAHVPSDTVSEKHRRERHTRGVGAAHDTDIYSTQAKWTSPITSELLFEAGFSATYTHPVIWPQPEVVADRTRVAKQDLTLGTTWNAAPGGQTHCQGPP